MEVKHFYVYELWNPLNNKVFYVGKGRKYGKKERGYYRLSNHIKDSKYAKNGKIKMNYRYRTILKILDAGKKPEMKIIFEHTDHNLIIEKEKELIKLYGRKDNKSGILCNHTNGGEGMLGYTHPKEHIHRLKTDNKGGQATARPVYAICPITFEIVKEYPSARVAGLELKNRTLARTGISSCAKTSKGHTAFGYYWRYVSEYDPHEDFEKLNKLRDNSFRNSKSVTQLEVDGTVVKIWESASDVCKFYGNCVQALFQHLQKGDIWNGYKWIYTPK